MNDTCGPIRHSVRVISAGHVSVYLAVFLLTVVGCAESPVTSQYRPPPPDQTVRLPVVAYGKDVLTSTQPLAMKADRRTELQGEIANLPSDYSMDDALVAVNVFDNRGALVAGTIAKTNVIGANKVSYQATISRLPPPGQYQLGVFLAGIKNEVGRFKIEIDK